MGSICVALALVVGTALAGCGSSASDKTASLVETIQQRGTLRVGVAPNKPNLYQEGSSGAWKGFFADFANSWAKTLGVKVEFVPCTFGTMIAGLQSDKFDLGMDLNQRAARALAVNFSEGLVTEIGCFVFDGSRVPAKSYQELNNAKYSVAVPQGAAEDLGLTAQDPAVKIVRLQQDSACYASLLAGRVDATFSNWAGGAQFASQNPGMKILFPPLAFVNEPEAIAMNKKYGYGDVQALNIAIDEFIKTGGVAKAQKTNGLISPLPYAIVPVPAYAQTAAGNQFPQ
jgi:polar amino acid transport system substrate-binding protein